MHALIKNKLEELTSLCEKYDVENMYIFGSAVTSDFNSESDIDFLINFKDISVEKYTDNYFELRAQLELMFNRKIDLVTERSLSNPYLIQQIKKNKQLLYAA